MNDKYLVIIALVVIALSCLWIMGADAENAITAIISGLCGIAVGHVPQRQPDNSQNGSDNSNS